MKMIAKTGLLGLVAAITITLSSFKAETEPELKSNEVNAEILEENEWSQVYNFIDEKICTAISQHDEENGKAVKMHYFSRCPSGYQSVLATKDDAVKTSNYVYGRINFYSGCSPKYVCSFKVNVDKGIAMVKTKDMKEYVAVSDWLQKKEAGKVIVKG